MLVKSWHLAFCNKHRHTHISHRRKVVCTFDWAINQTKLLHYSSAKNLSLWEWTPFLVLFANLTEIKDTLTQIQSNESQFFWWSSYIFENRDERQRILILMSSCLMVNVPSDSKPGSLTTPGLTTLRRSPNFPSKFLSRWLPLIGKTLK
jgi:hypothetical protein